MNSKPENNSNEGDSSYESPSARFGENKLLGIVFIILTMTCISFANISAKWASTEHHPIDILFYRNMGALIIMAFYIKARYGNFKILKTTRIQSHIKRGLIGTIGVGSAFGAYAAMPATDATILLFTVPIFTALLSMPILNEIVGPLRWGAILVGFVGVYIAVNPTGIAHGNINWEGISLGIISAIASALTALFVRDLGKTEPAVRTVFYFLTIGLIILTPFMFFVAKFPTLPMFGILSLVGVLGFCSQLLKSNAYAIAPAALLAPFIYTMLIWSVLADIIIWNTMPTKEVLIGGTIIIVSNLFLAWRERKNKS